MPFYPIQTNFTAGELSPLLALRVDFNKYANGVELLRNWLPLPQGGAVRRPCSHFVAEVKTSTKKTRLLPFEFSTTQAYIVEAGDQYFRFYKNNGRIGKAVTGAVNNGSGLIRLTSVAHGLTTGDKVYVADVGGVPNATGQWTITKITNDTFDLQGSTFAGAYTSGGYWVVEIVTPYGEADLFDLKYAQSADTLYIVHPLYQPRKLTRTSHTTWTLTLIDLSDGPYFDENIITPNSKPSTITITPSAATGNGVTLTASSALWTSTDIGRFVRLREGSTWGWVVIRTYVSPTQVTADIVGTLTNTNAKTVWRLGAFSYTTGFPGAITFFEERLAFGGSTSQPQTVWLSNSGDYEDMTPTLTNGTVQDDHALTYTLASNQVNVIKWLSSSIGLIIGTVGAEFALFGGNDSPLTPTNVTVRRQSTRGSSFVAPVVLGDSVVFVQRSGRKMRELAFDANSGKYKTPDLSLLASHVFDQAVLNSYAVEMSYQQEPYSVVWFVLSSGLLGSMTYIAEQEVIAFALHTDQMSNFESVASIPSADGLRDEAWVITKGTVSGSTKRYVEYFDPALYVDHGLTYSGAPTTTLTGLSHLEGKTVQINGDGAVYPDKVVSGGSITLDGPAVTSAQVGIFVNCMINTLSPEVKMPNGGTSQGRQRRWAEVFVRLYQSLGLIIEGDQVPFRSAGDPMDSAPPIFTGDIRVSNSGWDRQGKLSIQQLQPLPATVLGYFGSLDVGGAGD